MKKGKLFVLFALVIFVFSCGGGNGGDLPSSRVETLYQLTFVGSNLDDIVFPLFGYLAENCPSTNLSINISDIPCDKGGTWSYTGNAKCEKTIESNTITLRIISMTNTKYSLNECASENSDLDTNGDGASETTNIKLTADISPMSFNNTTVVAVFPGDPYTTEPTSAILNGTATVGFNNIHLGGDFTATLSFNEEFTFTNYDIIQNLNPPSCSQNTVMATENGQSGTCTIQSNCYKCL